MYECSCTTRTHTCMHKSRHKYTRVHALWPTSPSRLALLIRGTMWHSIPSGTRHQLCQLCIVLCLLESMRPSRGPCLPLSLSLSLFHRLSSCLPYMNRDGCRLLAFGLQSAPKLKMNGCVFVMEHCWEILFPRLIVCLCVPPNFQPSSN